MHQYVGPNSPLPTLTRAAVLGEFGGLGLRLEGHQLVPEDSFSYQEMHSPAELEVSLRDTHAIYLADRIIYGQAWKSSMQSCADYTIETCTHKEDHAGDENG